MSGRQFTIINCDLFESEEFRKLSGSDTRIALLAAYTTRSNNQLGLFRYPLATWSDDAQLDLATLGQAIDELRATSFVEYDADNRMLRICGWFRNHAPKNPKHVLSLIKAIKLPGNASDQLTRQFAELVLAIADASDTWNSETADFLTMTKLIRSTADAIQMDSNGMLAMEVSDLLHHARPSTEGKVRSLLFNFDLGQALLRPEPDTVSIQKSERIEEKEEDKENRFSGVTTVEDLGRQERLGASNAAKRSSLARMAISSKNPT